MKLTFPRKFPMKIALPGFRMIASIVNMYVLDWCTYNPGDLGNGNKQGAPCKFPFTYNGTTYDGECVADEKRFPYPWCFTTDDTSDKAPFGYCTSVCPKDGKGL